MKRTLIVVALAGMMVGCGDGPTAPSPDWPECSCDLPANTKCTTESGYAQSHFWKGAYCPAM